jgi:hypothetical protein
VPTIEILSPMSETCAPGIFNVEGEHDLGKRPKGTPKIKCFTRHAGTGEYTYHSQCDPLVDGTWTCRMDLMTGHNYDIRAVLYDGDAPWPNTPPDEVYNIVVTTTPPIIIIPPPMIRADDKLLTGKTDRAITGRIICTIFRKSKKSGLYLPVSQYVSTGRSEDRWYLYAEDPPVLHRPEDDDKEKMFVLTAAILNNKGRVKKGAIASLALRKAT